MRSSSHIFTNASKAWRTTVVIAGLSTLASCKHATPATPSPVLAPTTQPTGTVETDDDHPAAEIPIPPRDASAGPTLLAKVSNGYELRNRIVRLVIDEKTGDATWFGPADGSRNLLLRRGIWTSIANPSEIPPDGYIEKRDDQTWQYLGDDSTGLRWRKIYSLEGHSVFASFIIQNTRTEPANVAIHLNADFATFRITQRDNDALSGQSAFGSVTVRGFNEFHLTTKPPELPAMLVSDPQTLKPIERISFTTEWTFTPVIGRQ